MIDTCALWMGKAPMLYAEEIDRWVGAVVREHGLHQHDIVHLTLGTDSDRAALLASELSDEDVWMSPRKVLILRGVEELKSADAATLVEHLKAAESVWNVAFVQASGAVLKAIDALRTEPLHDFRIPDGTDQAADFGRSWLRSRGIEASATAMRNLADYSGEDRVGFASALTALAAVEANRELGWDDVRVHMSGTGAVKVFDITNAIARGDREGAVQGVLRLGSSHPLQLAKMLENRYRGYIAMLGGGKAADVAKQLGMSTSPFAVKRIEQEAKRLGSDRAVRSLAIVGEAQSGMKGESALPAEDVTVIMVSKLARLFASK